MGTIPGLGRNPRIGCGNPLQYSCLENSMERGAGWATVHEVPKSLTQLSLQKHAHIERKEKHLIFFFNFKIFNSYMRSHLIFESVAMIKIGKTYENYMIDLTPKNEKLKDRAIRIVSELANVSDAIALKTLLDANWSVKTAVLMLQCKLSFEEANLLLKKNHGVLRKALATLKKV